MFSDDDFRTLMRGLIPAILAVFVGLLLYGIASKVKNGNTNTILDPTNFLNFESLNKKFSFDDQNAFIVIYFHPDCDHCQYEALAIRDSLHRFAEANVVLVSDEPVERLQVFGEAYDLLDAPNVHILHDANGDFKRLFGTSSVPSIFIYNRDRELVKHYKGETKIEAILKYVNN